MTKIYEIRGKDRCRLKVHYCGMTIIAEFKPVAGAGVDSRSQLVARDQFVQDALEHDMRYGSLYRCVKGIDEQALTREEAVAEEKGSSPAKIIGTVKNLNDALVWFSKKGETPTSDEEVVELMAKYNVAFPKWKRDDAKE